MEQIKNALAGNGVVVFSKPACPNCERTKDFLKANNIEFSEIDIFENSEAMSYIKSVGVMQMPYVIADGEKWSGFSKARLQSI